MRIPRLCQPSSVRLTHCDEATTCMLRTEAMLSPHSNPRRYTHYTTWSVVELCVANLALDAGWRVRGWLVVELCDPSELRTVGLRVSGWFVRSSKPRTSLISHHKERCGDLSISIRFFEKRCSREHRRRDNQTYYLCLIRSSHLVLNSTARQMLSGCRCTSTIVHRTLLRYQWEYRSH